LQREKNEKMIAGAKMAAEAAKEKRRMLAVELLANNAGRIADSTAALDRRSAIALEILKCRRFTRSKLSKSSWLPAALYILLLTAGLE
jgi:hypothetical protein